MSRGVRYSPVVVDGVESVFYCWSRVVSSVRGFSEEFRVCRPGEFWLFTGWERRYTDFVSKYVKPSGYITVSLRSRELFRWGVFEFLAKLPRFERGPMLWFGFELEDLFGGGVLHFMWASDRGVLKAFAGSFNSRVEMDLTKYLPSDVSSEKHLYKIVYRRGLALWYIDDRLRAIAIISAGDLRDSRVLYNEKPYTIGFTRDTPPSSLPILLDIDGGDVEKAYEWEDLHPWCLRVSHGDPDTQIIMDLYRDGGDERLAGADVEGEVVSAPIPGTLRRKEVIFMAGASGSLAVETLVGGEWAEYRRLDIDGRKPYSISIENRNLLYRVIFRPRTPTKIMEAKTVLE